MTPEARRAYVRGLYGDLGPMIEWAVQALLRGADSEALVLLAGFSPRDRGEDVRRQFRRALEDVGERPDDDDEEIVRYAADLSKKVLLGTFPAREPARTIAQFAVDTDHRTELMRWYAVDDEYCLADSGFSTIEHTNKRAMDAARELVEKCEPSISV